MYKTFDVLKLDKSIDVNDLQSANKCPILATLLVSRFDKFTDFKEVQPTNKLAYYSLLHLT